MDTNEPVTDWLKQVRDKPQSDATRSLWEHYFHRLMKLARKKLKGLPRRAADEEDVALSAFKSFCRAVQDDCFPKLDDREDLWQILVMLTLRKAIKLIQHESRDKRDFRKVVHEERHANGTESVLSLFHEVVSREPNPHLEAQVVDDLEYLLAKLTQPQFEQVGTQLREIALRKLDGYTNAEIAQQMPCSLATVERRLGLIRDLWKGCLPN